MEVRDHRLISYTYALCAIAKMSKKAMQSNISIFPNDVNCNFITIE